MKSNLTLVAVFIICITSFGQTFKEKPIPIKEIEKGIMDFDYFRAVLLENGFVYKNKDHHGEYWHVPAPDGEGWQAMIQFTVWLSDGKEHRRNVFFQIDTDYLSVYNENFLASVKEAYPEKKAIAVEKKVGNDAPTTDYQLNYFSNSSDIRVAVTNSEARHSYYFKLDL